MDDSAEDLEEWYAKYTAAEDDRKLIRSDIIKALDDDKLDIDSVEKWIKESMPHIDIAHGFCSTCQSSFDDWPDMVMAGSAPAGGHDRAWVTRHYHKDTYALEASKRIGCGFCALLMQSLADDDISLDVYRKIEQRLNRLAKSGPLQVTIQRWGNSGSQTLWLNMPGRILTSQTF